MIPYIEALAWNAEKTALFPVSLVEPSECWFEVSYYGLGECEIYAPASGANLVALQKGRFVKMPHVGFLWVLISVEYHFSADGARMISARGIEAKSVAGKRIIRDPLALKSADDLRAAMNTLFALNIGADASAARQIGGFVYDFSALSGKETAAQATRENLLTYTQALLKTYGVGTISTVNAAGKILFEAIEGQNKSGTVIFSQSFDNLISATFFTSDENKKTNAQIVSTFSQDDESVEYVQYQPAEDGGASGIDRAELIVQANLSTKLKQEDGTEIDIAPTDDEYIAMQKAEGAAALGEHQTVTEFNGEIDLAHSGYTFGVDFNIGDLVAIRDEYFGISSTARVTKYTFKQDAGGYGEQAEYGNE